MPEPTTTTSARSDFDRLGASTARMSIQSDCVCSSRTFMAHPSQKGPTARQKKGSFVARYGLWSRPSEISACDARDNNWRRPGRPLNAMSPRISPQHLRQHDEPCRGRLKIDLEEDRTMICPIQSLRRVGCGCRCSKSTEVRCSLAKACGGRFRSN